MSKTTNTTRTLITSPDGHGSPPRRPNSRHRHEPAFTWKEAHSAGLVNSRTVYDQGSLAAREMIRQNDRSDIPPERWTMGKAMTIALARPYVQQAETVMNAGLAKEVDPRLDRVENLQQGTRAAIDAANADQGMFTFHRRPVRPTTSRKRSSRSPATTLSSWTTKRLV